MKLINTAGVTVFEGTSENGGSQPSPDRYLLAQWDFSEPYSVDSEAGQVLARVLSPLAFTQTGPDNAQTQGALVAPAPFGNAHVTGNADLGTGVVSAAVDDRTVDPGVVTINGPTGLDPLVTQNAPMLANNWPTERRVNGLTCFVLAADNPNTDGEYLRFTHDAERVRYPDIFLVQQLDEIVAQTGIYGSSAFDFPTIFAYDNGDDIVWAYAVFYDDGEVIRTTDVPVDTDLHVVSLAWRLGATVGLYIDGVLHPWAEPDPEGWADHASAGPNFDFYCAGTAGNESVATPGAAGAYCEARIYSTLTAAEHLAVAAELLAKWQPA